MRPVRQARINDEMRRVLAEAIAHSLKDPRIPAMTSLTDVRVSGDLSQAKCYVSIYASDAERKACLEVLRRAEGFLRAEIARGMRIRLVPDLIFLEDRSIEEGNRLDRLIDEAMGRHERT